jgi:hypothetical protein
VTLVRKAALHRNRRTAFRRRQKKPTRLFHPKTPQILNGRAAKVTAKSSGEMRGMYPHFLCKLSNSQGTTERLMHDIGGPGEPPRAEIFFASLLQHCHLKEQCFNSQRREIIGQLKFVVHFIRERYQWPIRYRPRFLEHCAISPAGIDFDIHQQNRLSLYPLIVILTGRIKC